MDQMPIETMFSSPVSFGEFGKGGGRVGKSGRTCGIILNVKTERGDEAEDAHGRNSGS